MSRSRQSFPFSKYSLSPERNKRRVTTTSPARNCCWLNLRRRILRTTAGALPAEAVSRGGVILRNCGANIGLLCLSRLRIFSDLLHFLRCARTDFGFVPVPTRHFVSQVELRGIVLVG